MELRKILISNYKSIESLELPLTRVNNSLTFSLLGVNESGKSSILKAISFIENNELTFPLDFHNKDIPVEVSFSYKLENYEKIQLEEHFEKTFEAPKQFIRQLGIESIELTKVINNVNPVTEVKKQILTFKNETIENFKFETGKILEEKETKSAIVLKDFFYTNLPNYFWDEIHSIVFWKSDAKYLISNAINLQQFATNPTGISIPLLNCFELIGISESEIAAEIAKLNNPATIHNIEQRLNDKVTEHIKKVWNGHPILIKFKINNNLLSLLVEDEGVSYDAKVTSQRSDGFRQFISFLLTVSIENSNDKLQYTILLLDEPETHLHPTAQLNLRDELLKITRNRDDNNIVFYATHSNYLIDKSNLNRSFKVIKADNVKTTLEKISKTQTSYSEINFEVFDIPTNDYHNELYGFIEENNKPKFNALIKDKDWIKQPSGNTIQVSLSTYIRHSIHHPENTSNRKFSEASLRKSINILRKIKDEL
jgi:predicted ATP-dependent endonuclease of OLD family